MYLTRSAVAKPSPIAMMNPATMNIDDNRLCKANDVMNRFSSNSQEAIPPKFGSNPAIDEVNSISPKVYALSLIFSVKDIDWLSCKPEDRNNPAFAIEWAKA